ncbi:YidB family protein [Mesorhizobium sp. B2-1-8]|uniref:YidB family protein n=1 Tax=unclassified Mesorhizobium TaxID=325217 RepID=UPI001CC90BC7|nr:MULTISPECIES: YidB family protein [unclassified Mesorhizobium]MBZ9673623.1 YidB family protein [Mesorhizobium sp. ES1-3]UCI18406.1 YidB family protein [Mesorhizobium sp. B2-1-8]
MERESAIQTIPTVGFWTRSPRGVSATALGDILDRFRNAGAGSKADSWVGAGPNEPIKPHEVETAIDAQILEALSRQTGLSREELIARITRDLPDAIDRKTPNGNLPTDHQTNVSVEPMLLDVVPQTWRGVPAR